MSCCCHQFCLLIYLGDFVVIPFAAHFYTYHKSSLRCMKIFMQVFILVYIFVALLYLYLSVYVVEYVSVCVCL